MVTFYTLGQMGRLGNQLFQYAALKSLALKNNFEVKIPNPQTRKWHGQTCLLDQFNLEVDYLTEEDIHTLEQSYQEPDWKTYDKNFFNIPDNTDITGFFQSLFYFEEFKDKIKKELTGITDGTKLFFALRQVWMNWANKNAKEWSYLHSTAVAKKDFGRALAVMLKKDDLIIKKQGNKLTDLK